VAAPPPLEFAASHAALPVVMPVSDGLRLYCSTRDDQGRSHVVAARLDLADGTANFEQAPVIAPGPIGSFDDRGVTSSCVVADGERVLHYYTGWNLGVTVPFYLAIGCAAGSGEDRRLEKISPAPILGRSSIDPLLTASPSVLVENGTWRMWYVSGTDWYLEDGEVRPRYLVKYAESDDGVSWRPTGLVCIDYRDADETAIGRPCVLKDEGIYKMWYCARGPAYRLGYAESFDGLAWDRKDDEIEWAGPAERWDSDMQAYPFVFDRDGERLMLYNGNGYGATGIGLATLVAD
jgi:hypothetical protein